jgi:hypothetical protein
MVPMECGNPGLNQGFRVEMFFILGRRDSLLEKLWLLGDIN